MTALLRGTCSVLMRDMIDMADYIHLGGIPCLIN